MQIIRFTVAICLLAWIVPGCAVTEPNDSDIERVRAAAAERAEVRFSIADLARDLGISESAVLAAMPDTLRVGLPADDLERVFTDLQAFESIAIEVDYGGRKITGMPEPPLRVEHLDTELLVLAGGDEWGGEWRTRYRVKFDPADLVYVWMYRVETVGDRKRAVAFFDSAGDRVMTWWFPGDEQSLETFDAMWRRYME